jgi:uncharacterized protein (TIGR00255 family)
MTGFASQSGAYGTAEWQWDIRGVNNKGLDVRLRLPEGIDGLEQKVRTNVATRLGRGSIQLGLRLTRGETNGALSVNPEMLSLVLAALAQIEDQAVATGLTLGQPTPADVLNQRGILEMVASEPMSEEENVAMLADLDPLLDAFITMRMNEGAAMHAVLAAQVDRIDALTEQAVVAAKARQEGAKDALKRALARVLDNADGVDADRLTQELALIAVKSDITEEIDRLRAHVVAARDLMTSDAPYGRRMDFLMQEFNREANTLCSKSGSTDLTAIGLDLKVVIDQMREQVQNVE